MNHMTNMTVKTKGLNENFGKAISEYADDIKNVFDFGLDFNAKLKVA